MFRRQNDNMSLISGPASVKNRLKKSLGSSSSPGGSRSSSFRIVEHNEITDLIEIQLSREEKLKGEIFEELTSMKEEILGRFASDGQTSNSLEAGFFRAITEKAMETIEQKLSKQDRISSTILDFLKEQNCLIRNWLEIQASATDEAGSVGGLSDAGESKMGTSTELACFDGRAMPSGRLMRRKGKKGSAKPPKDLLPEHACIHFSTFNGELFSEDAEWWLNRMELYFEYYSKTDQQKIAFAVLHFVDTALMWWLDYKNKVANGERDPLSSWLEFRKVFAETFFLENVQLDLRRRFYGLEQEASVHEYSSKFWKIAVRLRGFPEKEKLFKYIYGLRETLREEVLERHPSTLAEAFYLAKTLESARPVSGTLAPANKTVWTGLLHGRSIRNRET